MKKGLIAVAVLWSAIMLFGCSQGQVAVTDIKNFPTDSLAEIISQTDVTIDKDVSATGHGSVKMTANQPKTVRLFETGPLDIDNARLSYKAKLRTGDVKGQAYLEMWCSFPGKGEYFSRGLQSPLSGTNGWTTAETPFFLKKGQKPDNVKLNVVIDGTGTVWIDDVKLSMAPLQ
ncbi:MAG TPA: hypothetical protein VK463_07060 [Desulfomonilaceae bacterium]|nr:hypothetical protein [Desulfomonilaceae bacterium]